MEDNQKCCKDEVSKLQKHYDAIVTKCDEIKKNYEIALRENLERKKAEVSEKSLELENKKKQLMDLAKFLKEKHSTMSDYCLIDNLRNLTNILSTNDSEIDQGNLSMRYKSGDIGEDLVESMMGRTFDLDDITVTEINSFQYGCHEGSK